MEYVVLNILLLLMLALLFAVIGAALAGGGWVMWRYLERRARHTSPGSQTRLMD